MELAGSLVVRLGPTAKSKSGPSDGTSDSSPPRVRVRGSALVNVESSVEEVGVGEGEGGDLVLDFCPPYWAAKSCTGCPPFEDALCSLVGGSSWTEEVLGLLGSNMEARSWGCGGEVDIEVGVRGGERGVLGGIGGWRRNTFAKLKEFP